MRRYTSLAELPAELYEAILDQLDPSELQRSTLALCLAIPRAPVSRDYLYRHIIISSRSQTQKLWRRLELSKNEDGEWAVTRRIKSFCLNTFDTDADVLYKYTLFHFPQKSKSIADNMLKLSAIQLIPRIQFLHLNIGTTFGPEHLDDLFKRPQRHLSYLSLRFRP